MSHEPAVTWLSPTTVDEAFPTVVFTPVETVRSWNPVELETREVWRGSSRRHTGHEVGLCVRGDEEGSWRLSVVGRMPIGGKTFVVSDVLNFPELTPLVRGHKGELRGRDASMQCFDYALWNVEVPSEDAPAVITLVSLETGQTQPLNVSLPPGRPSVQTTGSGRLRLVWTSSGEVREVDLRSLTMTREPFEVARQSALRRRGEKGMPHNWLRTRGPERAQAGGHPHEQAYLSFHIRQRAGPRQAG
jgi:hypothetical protein